MQTTSNAAPEGAQPVDWERLTEEYFGEVQRLRTKIAAAMQRLNESGTGEMGLLDTIHAVHAILKD